MAVTPLTTLSAVKTIFEVSSGDTSQDNLLNLLLNEASQIITSYCNRQDFGVASYTDFPAGHNVNGIILRYPPVLGQTLSGNTTAGSATITGLASTSGLFLYQSVFGSGIPNPAVITAIGPGNQITLGSVSNGVISQALATATATGVSLAFGIALWQDDNAYGGSSPNAFALSTLLTEGSQYWLQYDQGLGTPCSDGVVHNIGGYFFQGAAFTIPLITPQVGPRMGNLKVQYTAGFATIPPDVEAACEMLLAGMRLQGIYGRMVSNLGDGRLSVGLTQREKLGLMSPEISTLLAKGGYLILALGE